MVTTYTIAADINVGKQIKRGYYTVDNQWSFEESYPDIEFFIRKEDAVIALNGILIRVSFNKHTNIQRVFILNDKGKVIVQKDLY